MIGELGKGTEHGGSVHFFLLSSSIRSLGVHAFSILCHEVSLWVSHGPAKAVVVQLTL